MKIRSVGDELLQTHRQAGRLKFVTMRNISNTVTGTGTTKTF